MRLLYGAMDDLIDVAPLLEQLPTEASTTTTAASATATRPATRSSSRVPPVLCVPHHGHLDNLCADDAERLVTPVVLQWIGAA